MTYSNVADVRAYTGVTPADLQLETDVELDELLACWLTQVSDLINADRNRDYEADGEVPAGIDQIAMELAARVVTNAAQTREGMVVKLDDFSTQFVTAQLLDVEMRRRLRRYPKRSRLRAWRMRSSGELEDADG